MFWLFSIDTTTVSYCLLEFFLCILKKETLFLGLLSCHSKPTERVIDFSGIWIKSLYSLEVQVYGNRTKRNCPEFGSGPLLQAAFLSSEEFFPIWNQLPLRMLKEVEPWIWPKNSSSLQAGLLVDLPVLSRDALTKLWAHCPLHSESRALGDTGSGQCPSAPLPAQRGELGPLQGRKEFSMCHLLYLHHMVLLLVMPTLNKMMLSAPRGFLIQMATGSGHQVKHRGLVPNYFFPIVH